MKLLPTITTTSPDWRKKIEEIEELQIKEFSVFPTCIDLEERKELYKLLENIKAKNIPFVHLKSDMKLWELDYFIKNYNTKVFNTHSNRELSIPKEWQKYKKIIYIENTYYPLDEKEIREFAGICLDLSHLESSRIYQPERFKNDVKLIEKYGCGCNHISPVKGWNIFSKAKEKKQTGAKDHFLESFSELDYLKKYPLSYFTEYTALEMENSIKEQLKAKDYIIKLLKIV